MADIYRAWTFQTHSDYVVSDFWNLVKMNPEIQIFWMQTESHHKLIHVGYIQFSTEVSQDVVLRVIPYAMVFPVRRGPSKVIANRSILPLYTWAGPMKYGDFDPLEEEELSIGSKKRKYSQIRHTVSYRKIIK